MPDKNALSATGATPTRRGLAHLRKDRYRFGRWGSRLESRSPSHNSRTRHLIPEKNRKSKHTGRGGQTEPIHRRSRLHSRPHPLKRRPPPLESVVVSEPDDDARGRTHTTSLVVTLRSLIGSGDGTDGVAASSGILSNAPSNIRSAASITSLCRVSAARAWATVAP